MREKMASLSIEEKVFEGIKNEENLDEINLKQSEEFFINKKRQKIHFRSYWPKEALRGIVIFIHGYASHINRPTQPYISEMLTSNNLAYITFDFHGHGYSDGLKSFIESYDDLIHDALQMIEISFSRESGNYDFRISDQRPSKEESKNLPLFLMGHSMGGALVSLLGLKLSEEPYKDIPFKGALYYAPALAFTEPPYIVEFILRNFVSPLFPDSPIPPFMSSVNLDDSYNWKDENYIRYIKHDHYPANPRGLTYGDPMRFQTAASLMDLVRDAANRHGEVSFPFIIFHDPADRVSQISGSEALLRLSRTPEASKQLVRVEDGRHDVITNQLQYVLEASIQWIHQMIH